MMSSTQSTGASRSPTGGVSRRDSLVMAAFDQIARAGLEGLRLRNVAAAVGLDHSTLHHYFPTKEALIAGVLRYTTDQLRTSLRSDGSRADQLRRHLRFVSQTIQDRPELFLVLAE